MRRRAYREYFVKGISAKIPKRKKITKLIKMVNENWVSCDEQDRREIKLYSAVKRSKSLSKKNLKINLTRLSYRIL